MLRFAPLLLVALAAPAHADERRFMLTGFERIRLEGPFEVEVTTGGSTGAVATGDARSLDRVSVRVDGRTLVVASSVNAWGGYPGAVRSLPRVTVSASELSSAVVTGGGRLSIDRMRGQHIALALTGAGALTVGHADADRLEATLVGTGALTVAGAALQARFQSNGAGTIAAEGLDVGALTVTTQSAGDSRFSARHTATVSASGQGVVQVAGTATCTVRGTAAVDCGKLPAR